MLLKVRHDTAADRMKGHASYAIRQTMLSVAGNLPTLLEVVAGGQHRWRQTFLQTLRGLPVDESIADAVFAFCCQQVQRRYGQVPAGELLDALEINTGPTQREIDDAWEVESFSSESGRRYFYGADGHPEELVKRLREH